MKPEGGGGGRSVWELAAASVGWERPDEIALSALTSTREHRGLLIYEKSKD